MVAATRKGDSVYSSMTVAAYEQFDRVQAARAPYLRGEIRTRVTDALADRSGR
jgi:hypothetical protein